MKKINVDLPVRKESLSAEITDSDAYFFGLELFNDSMLVDRDRALEGITNEARIEQIKEEFDRKLGWEFFNKSQKDRAVRNRVACRLTEIFGTQLRGLVEFTPGKEEHLDSSRIRLDMEDLMAILVKIIQTLDASTVAKVRNEKSKLLADAYKPTTQAEDIESQLEWEAEQKKMNWAEEGKDDEDIEVLEPEPVEDDIESILSRLSPEEANKIRNSIPAI